MPWLTIQFFKRLGGINSCKGSAPFSSSSSQLKSSLFRRLPDDVFAVTTGPQPPGEELICSAAIPIHHPPRSVFYIHLPMKIKGWCGALLKIAGRISVKRKDFIFYPGRSSSRLPPNWRRLACFSSVYWKAKCPRKNRRCLGPSNATSPGEACITYAIITFRLSVLVFQGFAQGALGQAQVTRGCRQEIL